MSVPRTLHVVSRLGLSALLAVVLTVVDCSLPAQRGAAVNQPAAQVVVIGAPVTAFAINTQR